MKHHWPADRVERRKVADLAPYAGNARTHPDAQVDKIVRSINEFGFTVPVLVEPSGTIIAGHGRVLAAKRLGLETIPVMVAEGWSDEKRRAYVIADNKLTLDGGWDPEMLRIEFAALEAGGFDLALTGFDAGELDAIRLPGSAGNTDPDEVPEAPVQPVSRRGDLWLLGSHRLLCGDSTEAADVAKVLGAVKPHLMVTDPPYGIEYDAAWRNDALRADGSAIGGRAIGKVLNDDRADWRAAWALFPGDVAYVWHAGTRAHVVADSLIACDFEIRASIVWAKSQLVISRGHYHPQHEPCWYAVRKGKKGHWSGDRKQTTLWQIDKPKKSETGHSTQKPVECMKRPIENNSSTGQAVYEPFSGSGTTIIACEITGRAAHAIELNPAYVDVAVQRWQAHTGQKARHEDGRAFEEIAAERLQKAA